VSNRRLIPLALGAVALLAIVALAARGGTFHSGGGGGSGPSASFWNYAFTSVFALEVLLFIGGIWVIWIIRPDIRQSGGARISSPGRTLRSLLFLIGGVALLLYVFWRRHTPASSFLHGLGKPGHPHPGKHATRHLAVEWWEIFVVLGLVVAVGVASVGQRKRLGQPPRRLATAPETLAAALDASLDDLRNDPDLRRAIVAAYARMETALAAVGLPRHPAEAPLEYLERVLLSLDASAGAVRSLTDLFEWARFSHHEPEPSMRDEAVDALVAVRDELRNAVGQLA
jgi:hypothetical protein